MTAAGVACAAYGTDLRANAKFCDECGAPVAAHGPSAEYKQVTVLYRAFRDRYRAMATSLGFEGHMAMAEAMP